MTTETTLLILVSMNQVLSVGIAVVALISRERIERKLMFFHSAGKLMAEHELEKARIEIEQIKAQANLESAKTDARRVEIESRKQDQTERRANGQIIARSA